MSKKLKYGNIDQDDLLKYVQGELSDEERHALERELQKDLFASEALEGLSTRRIEEVRADLDKLESQLSKRVSGKSSVVWIRIAASIAILLTIGTLYFTVFSDMINRTDRMAVETESAEPSKENNIAERPLAPIESTGEELDKGEIFQESEVEKEIQETRTGEKIIEQQTKSFAAAPAEQDEEMKSEAIVTVAEDQALEAAVSNDTFLFVATEVMEDQMDIAIEPGEEREVLSEPQAMENQAIQTRARSMDMARPTAISESAAEELSGVEVPVASAKKLAYSDQGDKAASAIILSDSIHTSPVGGMVSFSEYITDNVNLPEAESPGTRAEVVLSFSVDPSGRPREIEIISTAGYVFDTEALRLLRDGPDWAPSQRKTHLQINFIIE